MFHQIAPGWDVLERVVEKNVIIGCTQCANVLGMLQRRYKGQLLQSRTLQTQQTLTGTKHETTS